MFASKALAKNTGHPHIIWLRTSRVLTGAILYQTFKSVDVADSLTALAGKSWAPARSWLPSLAIKVLAVKVFASPAS
jgi:hypothetical protein